MPTTVRISDVFVPELYLAYTAVNSPERTAFWESGIVARNAALDQAASSGGNVVELPFWRDLDSDSAPNLSDDTDNLGAVEKVEAGHQTGRNAYLNKIYRASDIAGELAGSNPMQQIRNRFGTFWMRQWQRRLIASCNGVLANNVLLNRGDMVLDVAGATNADVGAGTLFTRQNFTGAAFTMGDMESQLRAMAVHSMVYKRMVDNDDIDFIPDSQGQMTIPTFMGKRVIVDDSLPVTPAAGPDPGDAAARYTTILFGEGAFGYGEGTPTVPVEIDREVRGGRGGGIEVLVERKTWLLHPFGFQAVTAPGPIPANGLTYSLAELANPVIWMRVVERKSVPLAFLVTNG